MRQGKVVSVYFDDKALQILDKEVERQAKKEREAGLSGRAITNRSKLISHIVTEYLLESREGLLTIRQIKRCLEPVFAEYGVTKAVLFGSYARGEQTEHSDIDIAIDEGQVQGLAFFRLQTELSSTLGKTVDLQSLNGSNQEFLNTIREDMVVLYAA